MNDSNLRDPSFLPEDVLYDALWKEISWYGGDMYGYPFTALNMYMWYRSDLLDDPKDRSIHEALLARSRIRPDQLYRLGRALAACSFACTRSQRSCSMIASCWPGQISFLWRIRPM